MKATEILHPDQRQWKDKKGMIYKTKAYLVDKLRRAVYRWREQGYPHITDTARRLLQFWFDENIFKDTENSIERKTKAFHFLRPISAMFFLNPIHQS
jgi:type III restriction enzyme